MANQEKQSLPFAAIGLYVMAGVMGLLFVMSVIGMIIGAESRLFFLITAIIAAMMIALSLLSAHWFRVKRKERKPGFASYAFEGDFAPKKNPTVSSNEKGKSSKKR